MKTGNKEPIERVQERLAHYLGIPRRRSSQCQSQPGMGGGGGGHTTVLAILCTLMFVSVNQDELSESRDERL